MELQAEMLQLDLIDAEGGGTQEEAEDEREDERERLLLLIDERKEEERAAGRPDAEPALRDPDPPALVTMDTYRPKRPTTLNLFPQVPRTQVMRIFRLIDGMYREPKRPVSFNGSSRLCSFPTCRPRCLLLFHSPHTPNLYHQHL